MKEAIVCPTCNATNKPKAVTCRVCGERLVERREKGSRKAPVVLQRVMSGEMFSAVVVSGSEGVRRSRSALDAPALAPEAAVPTEPEPLSDADVSRIVREVLGHSQRGDFVQAIAMSDRILAERPRDTKALIVKADALFRAGHHREAAAVFDALVGLDPENAKLWLDRARIQKAMEEFPAALQSYDTALALDAKLADGWYERALVLESLKNLPGAIESLAKTLELKRDHPQAVRKRVDLERVQSRAAVQSVADDIEREIAQIEERARARVAANGAAAGDVLAEGPQAPVAEPEAPATAEAAAAAPAPAAGSSPKPRRERVTGRVFTYVDGLDEALNGGIPEGHVVVVAGPPGTLKSSVCLSVLAFNAAKEGRRVLYVSFEEAPDTLGMNARSLGLPVDDAPALLRIVDGRALADGLAADEGWVDGFAARLRALRAEHAFEILALDSLDGIEALGRFPDRRRAIFRLFEHLRGLGATALVVTERPDLVVQGVVITGRWAEDFLADGVVQLRHHFVSDVEVQRRVRVVKMRGTRHDPSFLSLLVEDGRLRVTRAMST